MPKHISYYFFASSIRSFSLNLLAYFRNFLFTRLKNFEPFFHPKSGCKSTNLFDYNPNFFSFFLELFFPKFLPFFISKSGCKSTNLFVYIPNFFSLFFSELFLILFPFLISKRGGKSSLSFLFNPNFFCFFFEFFFSINFQKTCFKLRRKFINYFFTSKVFLQINLELFLTFVLRSFYLENGLQIYDVFIFICKFFQDFFLTKFHLTCFQIFINPIHYLLKFYHKKKNTLYQV